jgi:hypothetical protein
MTKSDPYSLDGLVLRFRQGFRSLGGEGNHFLDMDTEWAYGLKQAFRSPDRPTKFADRHPATPIATVNLS